MKQWETRPSATTRDVYEVGDLLRSLVDCLASFETSSRRGCEYFPSRDWDLTKLYGAGSIADGMQAYYQFRWELSDDNSFI